MIVNCPNCEKQLKLSPKIQENIRKLGPGKKIKIKCAQCQTPFGLDAAKLVVDSAAKPEKKQKSGASADKFVQPPDFPDISWLKDGAFEDQEDVEDVPLALVLMPDTPARDVVIKAAEGIGYQVETPLSAKEAVNKMQFVNYASVFLHSAYEPGGVHSGVFHQYMRNLTMSRRRFMLYTLIGQEFKTLYDLQALAYSANLVVNDGEVSYLETILRKAIPEYEALFGPLMEELRIAGKD